DAMFGIDAALADNAMIPHRPSLFSQGGTGRTIVGLLGDYLAQLGGAKRLYAPMMAERAAMVAKRDDDAIARARTWSARMQQQDWLRSHPPMAQPPIIAED